MYIVSRCLIGVNCKYNGGNNLSDEVLRFLEGHTYITICPECAGKLTSPRPPAEQQKDRQGNILIIDSEGKDLTEAFNNGANISFQEVLNAARERGEEIEGAILKAKSPSCGVEQVYDGSFSGTTRDGYGVFAQLLKDKRIRLMTELDFKNFGE